MGMHFIQPTTKCRCRASWATGLLLYILWIGPSPGSSKIFGYSHVFLLC